MNLVSLEETKTIKCFDVTAFPLNRGIVDDMEFIMRSNHGIGLAAPQVGLALNMFIFDIGKGLHVVCNPKPFAHAKKGQSIKKEGCLTLPFNETYMVPRWNMITLFWQDRDGKSLEWCCIGLLAQVIQHECDHLLNLCIGGKDVGVSNSV